MACGWYLDGGSTTTPGTRHSVSSHRERGVWSVIIFDGADKQIGNGATQLHDDAPKRRPYH